MPGDLVIRPAMGGWNDLLRQPPWGSVFGHSLAEWFAKTRAELGLDTSRPVVATGHQTLLWHPGILAKYLAVEALRRRHDLAGANLIVDQHADGFGSFDAPFRRAGNSLSTRVFRLTTPRKGVPMGLHEPFTPPRPPAASGGALPSVTQGIARIYECVHAHRGAAHAARQMGLALDDLMGPWIEPLPSVTASELLETTFARHLLAKMADDPWTCAEHYNDAVRAVPEAGIGELLIRDDYVELPLWRIRDDGRRMHAYDHDVQNRVEHPTDAPVLMPRALMLTALVRLGMCDLFVHGLGGGVYDRAMEIWIESWLGVKPAPIAVVSATLHLPLIEESGPTSGAEPARQTLRRLKHDPDAGGAAPPSEAKQRLLDAIAQAPRGSRARREAFFKLHEYLCQARLDHAQTLTDAAGELERTRIREANRRIAARRTWPFPLYPQGMIDELAERIAGAVTGAACGP